MEEKTLIIVRGCSGSGKSAFAEWIANETCGAVTISGDNYPGYYDNPEREYRFDIETYRESQVWLRNTVESLMSMGTSPIVVHEVLARQEEPWFFTYLAGIYEYRAHVMIMENRHNGWSSHNVNEITLSAQEDAFDIKLTPHRRSPRLRGNGIEPATQF